MKTIDLSPLYSSSVGFDRLASILEGALRSNHSGQNYPPYNIEMVDENRYAITLAVAGFEEDELDLQVEQEVLTVRGNKDRDDKDHKYLYQGIANRNFEHKFNLAEYIEVTGARLQNGLLTIGLVKEVPEAMKPRRIEIKTGSRQLEHKSDKQKAA